MNKELLEEFMKSCKIVIKQKRIERRIRLGLSKDQTILSEFGKPSNECFEHARKKLEIAFELMKKGKRVFLEKNLTINDLKIRPDS